MVRQVDCAIMASMTDDEELREPTKPWPNEAPRAEAIAAVAAFEEEWWPEREEKQAARLGRAGHAAAPPPLGRAGKGRM